jgi:hypothetical protein
MNFLHRMTRRCGVGGTIAHRLMPPPFALRQPPLQRVHSQPEALSIDETHGRPTERRQKCSADVLEEHRAADEQLLPLIGWPSDRLGRHPLLITSCIGYAVVGYPFFLTASSGIIGLAVAAQLLMVLLYVPLCWRLPRAFMPRSSRCGCAVPPCRSATISPLRFLAGSRPLSPRFLARATDNSHARAAYVIITAIITLGILLRTREIAFCAAAVIGTIRAAA